MKKILLAIGLLLGMSSMWYAADGTLTWTANTEADLAGYKIFFAPQSCTAQGPLAPLLVGGVAAQVGKVVTYKHVGLPSIDGTLCWEITAFDTAGNESGRSNRVSIVVNTVPPVAPNGLSVVIQ